MPGRDCAEDWRRVKGGRGQMRRRYAVAISAMIMALPMGNGASAQGPSLEQLEVIQDLLEGNNVEKLRDYIAERPELLEGYTSLAQLLAQFMAESINVIGYLGLESTADGDSEERADSAVVPLY